MIDWRRVALALYEVWEKHWAGCFSLIVIWLLYRRLRYCTEALARAPLEKSRLLNETWQKAFEIVLRVQPRSLRELVDDTENESSHKP